MSNKQELLNGLRKKATKRQWTIPTIKVKLHDRVLAHRQGPLVETVPLEGQDTILTPVGCLALFCHPAGKQHAITREGTVPEQMAIASPDKG